VQLWAAASFFSAKRCGHASRNQVRCAHTMYVRKCITAARAAEGRRTRAH